jgi:predicted amidohydrolase YtcJ
MVPPEDLKRYVARLDAEGFQVHFHAIGDGAVQQSLDAVEYAQAINGPRDARHHISHLELIDPADVPRFRQLSVVANFQPLWAIKDDYITVLTLPFIGKDRGQWLYPIHSLQKSGATLAFGSDWNVTTPNVFAQIEVATTRLDPDGLTNEPLLPGEAIDLPTAIAAFTMGSAYVNGLENETGSIEVGKSADLIVIDRNLFEIESEEISETEVLLTLLEGKSVYGDLSP